MGLEGIVDHPFELDKPAFAHPRLTLALSIPSTVSMFHGLPWNSAPSRSKHQHPTAQLDITTTPYLEIDDT